MLLSVRTAKALQSATVMGLSESWVEVVPREKGYRGQVTKVQ
jgi:hypothetical protein